MSHDLLVYGRLAPHELDGLKERWTERVEHHGVELRFHPDFNPAFHGGYLPAMLVLRGGGLPGVDELVARRLHVGFDLYLEWFESMEDAGEGLEEVPPEVATVIRSSSFCAVFTLSVEDSAGCALGAFFAAVRLARLAHGVIVDPVEEVFWNPDQALQAAGSFFSATFPLRRCQRPDRPFDGW